MLLVKDDIYVKCIKWVMVVLDKLVVVEYVLELVLEFLWDYLEGELILVWVNFDLKLDLLFFFW